MRPIYSGIRKFFGLKDLVVSFYTQKCRFNCTFCSLPSNSSAVPVPIENINQQIDWVFNKYKDDLASIQQFSCGNEGSILDNERFYPESLDYLLIRCQEMTNLQVISLETRPEYITKKILENVLQKSASKKVDVTIGLETQDDQLRRQVLNKQFSKEMVEEKIKILGKCGVRLTSYVMVKPGPYMTEAEGIQEALATVEYLCQQCSRANVELIIYLNPTYNAEGSNFEQIVKENGYTPPKIQSVFNIITEAQRWAVPIYTGLWSESMDRKEKDYRGREGFDLNIEKAIKNFNKTKDFSYILAQKKQGKYFSIPSILPVGR